MMSQRKEKIPTKVHRCQFLKWKPSAILTSATNPNGDKMAIGKENGDIEIWNLTNGWHIESTIRGSTHAKLTKLIWSNSSEKKKSERLFASTMTGLVFEIDFLHLIPINVCESHGGAVWCMAYNTIKNALAIGCEDGRIRILSLANDCIEYERGFVSTEVRVVSIAWHESGDDLYSGSCNGIIYHWNASNGRSISRITLERRKEETIVWSLLILKDFTLISGNSIGKINCWDGKTGTLLQSFSYLGADVLCMTINENEKYLFASGIDSQVVMFERINNEFVYVKSQRPHTHDVRSLCIAKPKDTEILISGGLDTRLIWYSVPGFGEKYPKVFYNFPQQSIVSLAHEKRHLLIQKEHVLELWKLGDFECVVNNIDDCLSGERLHLRSQKEYSLAVQLNMSGHLNVVCSAISSNGSYIVCSTIEEMKLFQCDMNQKTVQVKKINLPEEFQEAALNVVFSPDSSRLIVSTQRGQIHVIDLNTMTIIKVFEEFMKTSNNNENVDTNIPAPIVTLRTSPDGQWLACGNCVNDILLFHMDTLKYYGKLPKPSSRHIALGFNQTGKTLIVSCVRDGFICYDVDSLTISEWSKNNTKTLEQLMKTSPGMFISIVHNPMYSNVILLQSQKYLLSIDLDKPMEKIIVEDENEKKRKLECLEENLTDQEEPEDINDKKKKKKQLKKKEKTLQKIKQYQVMHQFGPLMFLDFLSTKKELVVVEQPYLKIQQQLPDVLYRHKYGR